MKGDSEPMLISNYEFGDNSLLFLDRHTKSQSSDEKRDFRKKKHNNEKMLYRTMLYREFTIIAFYFDKWANCLE